MAERPIPLPIQRAVRQRCGFGCVVCGLPLNEYEHMLGFAAVPEHDPNEITLLCDQHHKERTNGLLPIERVREANSDPFNLREGVSKPYDFHYSGQECRVQIGGSDFTARDAGYGTQIIPLSIDNIPMIGFILGDGHLLLNLNVFDECNHCILRIANNALIYRPLPWDIQLTGRNLVVRQARANILIDLAFEVPATVIVRLGRFLLNGVEVVIDGEGLTVNGSAGQFQNCGFDNCSRGILIGPHETGGAVIIPDVPRYGRPH